LDEDLRKFEAELEQERALKQQQTKQALKASGQKPRSNKDKLINPQETNAMYVARVCFYYYVYLFIITFTYRAPTIPTPIIDGNFDMPIDPNEPVYCHCKRV
jgi:hypothetical protein